jgi:hypothetical protein
MNNMKETGYSLIVSLVILLGVGFMIFGADIDKAINKHRFEKQWRHDSIYALTHPSPLHVNATFTPYSYIQDTLFTRKYVDSLQAVIKHLRKQIQGLKNHNKELSNIHYYHYWFDGDSVVEALDDRVFVLIPVDVAPLEVH